ncbi:tautomerase family protein [Saccharopolyspora shandongensis]|uniref:tautomerase family protein n=1 Tax=Saccharopolyspora shandongensis TaxID=418495 RepID=UPI00342CDD8B
MLYIDLIEGRTPHQISSLLEGVHTAVVEAFGVPERDRYQVVRSHPADEVVALDSGLGIARTRNLVVVHMVSRKRQRTEKERFYTLLARNLADRCGLEASDLIVSIVENEDDDWSFGHGRAQFLTGELT